MYIQTIDWTGFDKYSENTCYCNCGYIFRSHSKFVGEVGKCISKIPCPKCNKNDNLWKVSSDKESYQL